MLQASPAPRPSRPHPGVLARPRPAPPPLPPRVVTGWADFLDHARESGVDPAKALEGWDRRRSKVAGTPEAWAAARARMEAARHEALYRLGVDDVGMALDATEHALGEIKSGEAKHGGVDNYSPPLPFLFGFHEALERLGRMPTWQDALAHLREERGLVLDHFAARHGVAVDCLLGSWDRTPLLRALRWRVGLAYYSWFRETDLMVRLRRMHGIDVRYHVLVDAEWRADLVSGPALLELFVKNEEYKSDEAGRKIRAADMNPSLNVVRIGVEKRSARGKPWLLAEADVEDIARRLVAAGAGLIPELG